MGVFFNSTKEFLKAAEKGDTATVAKYLKDNKDGWLAARNKEGYGAMHVAARFGQDAIIKQLLEAGADVDTHSAGGETPLTSAIIWNKLSTIRLLIEKGANLKTGTNYEPLPLAVGRDHLEAVKLLLAAKADPEAANVLISAMSYNRYEIAEELVKAGAKLDTHDNYYRYAPHFAAMHGALDFMRFIIDREGVDINKQDNNGHTPLHYAVMYGHKLLLDFLLEKGARADIENNQMQLPVTLARERKQEAMVRALEAYERKNAPAAPVIEPQAPVAVVPQALQQQAVPAVQPYDDGVNEGWMRMGSSRVAHIGTYPAVGRKLTEIFNFTARERIIITENLRTGQENMTAPESFDNIAEEAVKKALEAFRMLGGSADDNAVLNPRGIKKQLRQP